jgi:hypothetical protein
VADGGYGMTTTRTCPARAGFPDVRSGDGNG